MAAFFNPVKVFLTVYLRITWLTDSETVMTRVCLVHFAGSDTSMANWYVLVSNSEWSYIALSTSLYSFFPQRDWLAF